MLHFQQGQRKVKGCNPYLWLKQKLLPLVDIHKTRKEDSILLWMSHVLVKNHLVVQNEKKRADQIGLCSGKIPKQEKLPTQKKKSM